MPAFSEGRARIPGAKGREGMRQLGSFCNSRVADRVDRRARAARMVLRDSSRWRSSRRSACSWRV
jgi:hypothetical protein